MRRGRIVIRTDADPAIGIGHVGRTLALAEAWRQLGGKVHYVASAPLAPSADAWIRTAGIPLDVLDTARYSDADAAATAAIAGHAPVVLDAFGTPHAYRTVLRDLVPRLAIIDDMGGGGPWSADIILNQNYGASPSYYPGQDPGTGLLLGPRYALLRPEFLRWRARPRRRDGQARRIAVSLGGTDPANITSLVLDALDHKAAAGWKALVVAGAANPRAAELKARAKTGSKIHVIRRPSSMARLLVWADVAILAGGVTVWEALALGVPSVGIAVAENQVQAAEALDRDGLWRYLGQASAVDIHRIGEAVKNLLADTGARRRLSETGQALVDGQGAARFADALARL